MISAFDTQKLRGLLRDFYAITRIRITVFDEDGNELVAYPEAVAEGCGIIRSSEAGRAACARCDREACQRAAGTRRTQIYRCHAGLTEAVAPIIVQDVLVGYLLFGHVLSYSDYGAAWAAVSRCTRELPVDKDALREAILRQELISESFVSSATHIMSAVASYLVMERMAVLNSDDLAVRLDRFISRHFTEDFTAADLCEMFGIGRTRIYQISRKLYGRGIAEEVRALRVSRAKELLRKNQLSLGEIAERCGYSDYNYFISVFTRETGLPPRRWQRENT